MFLPPPDRWLTRNFGRLALIQRDPQAVHHGETLLLVGLVMLALRMADAGLGADIGRVVWTALAPTASKGGTAEARLREFASGPDLPTLEAERIGVLALLIADLEKQRRAT